MIIMLIILIFLSLIKYLIFFDIILSWLTLLGIRFRPKFVSDIIDPLYKNIRSFIPTTMGPVDFTPIVVILLIMFIEGALSMIFPSEYLAVRQMSININN